jgi:PEP-CTERM motif
MKRLHLVLLLLVLALAAVPFASADTILLTSNNLGINATIGSVTMTQQAGGVMVTLQANSGYSFKLARGDIAFYTSGTLSSSDIQNLLIDGTYTSNFSLDSNKNVSQFGRFTYDLANLTKGTLPKGYVSASTISFFISNATLAQLQPYRWAVHFCVGGGTSCGTGVTGFASNGPTVPEPGTLSLLGTGIVGLAGFFRRRLLS